MGLVCVLYLGHHASTMLFSSLKKNQLPMHAAAGQEAKQKSTFEVPLNRAPCTARRSSAVVTTLQPKQTNKQILIWCSVVPGHGQGGKKNAKVRRRDLIFSKVVHAR